MRKKPKLKVAMLIDAWFPFVGGGQIHVQNLVKSLEKNYPVKVYLFHAPHHNIIIRTMWCLWVIPQVLIQSLVQRPFSLIHAHAFSAGIPAKILSLVLKIPVVYTVHGSHLMDLRSTNPKSTLEHLLLTRILYTAQISVTKSFLKYTNVNKRITVIPNGVNVGAFDKIKKPKYSQFTYLFVGRAHPTKGLSILRRAFANVKKLYPKIQLITITGQVTGKALIYAYKQAHAFVLPSLVEGQPLVILEAWAAKLPLIATKTTGVIEIASHRKNALLISPGNQAELEQALIQLYKMGKVGRNFLAKNGYDLVKNNYRWDKIAKATFEVYELCLSRNTTH